MKLSNRAVLVLRLVALKGARSQLQQEVTCRVCGFGYIQPLTPLVGKFSRWKMGPKRSVGILQPI